MTTRPLPKTKIDHNGDFALELFERARKRHLDESPNAIIPSAGGEIETIGERQFVVLSNINGFIRAFEIKGERLFEPSDDDASALAARWPD